FFLTVTARTVPSTLSLHDALPICVLSRLGFFTAGTGSVIKAAVPTWRPDVHGKADIVEEIVRIVGVDRIPMTPFARGDIGRKPRSEDHTSELQSRGHLVCRLLFEK